MPTVSANFAQIRNRKRDVPKQETGPRLISCFSLPWQNTKILKPNLEFAHQIDALSKFGKNGQLAQNGLCSESCVGIESHIGGEAVAIVTTSKRG